MRVCILMCGRDGNDEKLKALADAMAKGVASTGNEAEILSSSRDLGSKLLVYGHVVILAEAGTPGGGNLTACMDRFFKSAGTVTGKKCSCYLYASCLRKMKTLHLLMNFAEEQGMFLRISDIIRRSGEAFAIGKRIHE